MNRLEKEALLVVRGYCERVLGIIDEITEHNQTCTAQWIDGNLYDIVSDLGAAKDLTGRIKAATRSR